MPSTGLRRGVLVEGETGSTKQLAAAVVLDGPRRVRFGLAGLTSGALGVRILSIAQHFLNGNDWASWIVGFVIFDMGAAAAACSLLLLIGAVFAPTWLPRVLAAAIEKAEWARNVFFLLIVAWLLFMVVVLPILVLLKWLGVF
jgi:hypothetical protein